MIEIHKGEKYIIMTDGLTAEKSDGSNLRKMKYYSERDISALAGEIDELTAWQILLDVSNQTEASNTPISPQHIFIDGEKFILSEWSESQDKRFTAPEGYSPQWALAATVFYTCLGCHVFQSLGGKGQTKSTPIPTLRRELTELSDLVIRCLDFNPANRPELTEIANIAQDNVVRCKSMQYEFPPLKKIPDNKITSDEIDIYWPEEM